MGRQTEKQEQGDSGMIALEAAMSLPIFIFLILSLYSLTLLFTAQNMIGHALMQTSQSLSLETFSTEQLGYKWSIGTFISSGIKDLVSANDLNQDFVSDELWYKATYGGAPRVQEMCKSRFCAYLSGSTGAADTTLKALGIQGGVEGMNFDESKIEGQNLTITVHYKVKLLFGIRAFHMELFDFDTVQSVCSRLWANPDL